MTGGDPLSVLGLVPHRSHRVNSSVWTAVRAGMTPSQRQTALITMILFPLSLALSKMKSCSFFPE